MPPTKDDEAKEPLLPPPVTQARPSSSSTSPLRSKLNARKTSTSGPPLSEKSKGKQRADPDSSTATTPDVSKERLDSSEKSGTGNHEGRGRHVTVVFSNESESGGGNLEIWVEDGESVGSVKDQIRHLRPNLAPLSLKLIHAGRLLTDGILLVPWLRSLEERVRRQAGSVGQDVESVLKEVGLQDDEPDTNPNTSPSIGGGRRPLTGVSKGKGKGKEKERDSGERVWLHCNVGARLDEIEDNAKDDAEEPQAPRRRGFDVLLDAGLSAEEVANMRRQFYESRGEEVPEGMGIGDVNDEHARALEEQWIEGDLTADTATTTSEGMYSSILHGLLTGFLFPFSPFFFFKEPPIPNFFDADAEARGDEPVSELTERVTGHPDVGAVAVPSVVFGQRMQMGIILGTVINVAFGWLRFLN